MNKKAKKKEMFVVEQKVLSLTTDRSQSGGGAYFFAAWCNDSNRYILVANKEAQLPEFFEKPNSKCMGFFIKVYEKTTWKMIGSYKTYEECQSMIENKIGVPVSKRTRRITSD